MLPIYEETSHSIEIHEEKSSHFPPHLHHSMEIVYVTSGELALGVGQELYDMKVGDLAIVFPNLIHHYQVFHPGKQNTATHILASPLISQIFQEELDTLCPSNPVIHKDALHPEILDAVSKLRTLPREKGVAEQVKNLLESSYVQIILARAIPQYELVKKETAGSHDLIYQTVSYIAEHFREPVSLTGMAHDLGVSQFALSRVFSGTFHRNFNSYLNETRLNYACSLLLRTDQTVTDAALNSGFESLRTFHRVFREHFHQTPGSFRKTLPVGEEL